MMNPVFSGGEIEAIQRHKLTKLAQWELMREGEATLFIPLNGGSDTRRAAREFYADLARSQNVAFKRLGGFGVELGGIAMENTNDMDT